MRFVFWVFTALFALIAWQSVATAQTSDTPQPLAVLLERDPWLAVVGSDSPTIAIYGDGLVIYRTDDGFSSVRLNAAELDALRTNLALQEAEPFMGSYYEASPATDQLTSVLAYWVNGQRRAAMIYGGRVSVQNSTEVPQPLKRLSRLLADFRHVDGKPWLPDRFEVMIWPYEYAPEESVIWPSDWPDQNDSTSLRMGEDGFRLFLPADQFERFTTFLASRNDRGAVSIGGKKWAVSFRFPFPSERSWMPDRRAPEPEAI